MCVCVDLLMTYSQSESLFMLCFCLLSSQNMSLPFIKKEVPAYFLQIDEQQVQSISNGFYSSVEDVKLNIKCEPEVSFNFFINDEEQETYSAVTSTYDAESEITADSGEETDSNGTHKQPTAIFKCDVCPYANRKNPFNRHVAKHNRPDKDQCKICFRFVPITQLQTHIESRHICPFCKKIFVSYKSYTTHKGIHNGIRFECDICGNIYRQRSTLWDHMKNVHRKRNRDYKCEKCELSFYRRNTLNRHIKQQHSGKKIPEERVRCLNRSCNRQIKISSLKSHKCPQKRRTEGERRFICPKCGCGFFERYLLSRHLRKPCSPKKLSCDKCKKVFKKLHNYLKHGPLTCERMFECDYCSKLFTNKFSLQAHFGSAHGIAEFDTKVTCTVCSRTLSSTSKLKLHVKRYHEISDVNLS